jgi:hypothetical protein
MKRRAELTAEMCQRAAGFQPSSGFNQRYPCKKEEVIPSANV